MTPLSIQNAAPYWLVTQFFISGALFYIVGTTSLVYFDVLNLPILSFEMAAILHLLLLGFVMSTIFGAMYQLLSVVLEVPVFSKDLGYMQFAFYIVGLGLFVTSLFFNNTVYISYGALILYLSILVYAINILLSFRVLKTWNIKAYFILVAHLFLLIGVSYGLLMSFELSGQGFGLDLNLLIQQHIASTLFGFVFEVILIIATILLPMFMLAHDYNKSLSWGILVTSVSGVIAYMNSFMLLGLVLLSITSVLFIIQVLDIYRKRVRKTSDIYSLHIMSSLYFLVASFGLLIYANTVYNESMLKVLSLVTIFGFLAFFLIGHIYKIVPFLVWNQRFSPLVGKQKVPLLADMVSKKASYLEYASKLVAITIWILALVLDNPILQSIAQGVLLISALLFLYNLIYIFRYKETV